MPQWQSRDSGHSASAYDVKLSGTNDKAEPNLHPALVLAVCKFYDEDESFSLSHKLYIVADESQSSFLYASSTHQT